MKTLLLLLMAAASSAVAATFQVPIAATGAGGSVTGSYSFSSPLVLSGTNVTIPSLQPYATNYNSLLSAYTNIISVNWSNDALSSGLNLTNITTKVATPGTLVKVGPGVFWIGTNEVSLLPPGVDLYLDGSIITMGTTADSGSIRYIFDDSLDGLGARTNRVFGSGSFYITNNQGGLVLMTETASELFIEYNIARTLGQQVLLSQDAGALTVVQKEYGQSDGYDFLVTAFPRKTAVYGGFIYANDSLLEFANSYTNWGDCIIQVKGGRLQDNVLPSTGSAGIAVAEKVLIDGGVWDLSNNGTITSSQTNKNYSGAEAIIQNAFIKSAGTNTKSTIQRVNASYATAMTIRNSTIWGPDGVDPITINPMAGFFTLENSRVISGASATNSIRAEVASSRLRLIGANSLDKPIGSNVSLQDSTNVMTSVKAKGLASIDGALNVGGAASFTNTSDFFADMIVHSPGTFQTDAGVSSLLQGEVLTTAGVNLGNLTASRALALNSNGDITNSAVTATELGYLSGVTSAIQTQLSNDVRVAQGSGITVTPSGSGGIMTYTVAATGGGGGTNFPPVITASTNVTVGTGVRQSLVFSSPSNQFLNFQGTGLNGETITGSFTNGGTTNVNWSFNISGSASSFYNPRVGSNVTSFAVPAGAIVINEWVYSTNNGARWRLNAGIGKEAELAVAGSLTLHTNSSASTITISNAPSSYSMVFGHAAHTYGTTAANVYWGGFFSATPTTAPGIYGEIVPKNGTVTALAWRVHATAGSGESITNSLWLNGTNGTLIATWEFPGNATTAYRTNMIGLSTAVTTNDVLVFTSRNPTMSSASTSSKQHATVIIE